MILVAKHLIITGRVQGVFYRGWAVQTAQALGLVGWVRNLRNGDVEAWVQGERGDVERFLGLAWDGPSAARVENVSIAHAEPGDFIDFRQRETA